MLPVSRLFSVVVFCLAAVAVFHAQDKRRVSEPTFPPVCAVVHAPLESTPDGPVVGATAAEQDIVSSEGSSAIASFFSECSGKAIELALGSEIQHNAFLINPISFPPGVSLIVDGGVTVYASRNPMNYQITPGLPACGTLTTRATSDVCQSLLTFEGDDNNQANSGLYGYGVLDGQGQPQEPERTARR